MKASINELVFGIIYLLLITPAISQKLYDGGYISTTCKYYSNSTYGVSLGLILLDKGSTKCYISTKDQPGPGRKGKGFRSCPEFSIGYLKNGNNNFIEGEFDLLFRHFPTSKFFLWGLGIKGKDSFNKTFDLGYSAILGIGFKKGYVFYERSFAYSGILNSIGLKFFFPRVFRFK